LERAPSCHDCASTPAPCHAISDANASSAAIAIRSHSAASLRGSSWYSASMRTWPRASSTNAKLHVEPIASA